MQDAGILKPVDHTTLMISSFVIVNKKQFDKNARP